MIILYSLYWPIVRQQAIFKITLHVLIMFTAFVLYVYDLHVYLCSA